MPEEATIRQAYVRLGRELGVPLVAANDCHYVKREHAAAHDVLLCIQTGKEIDEPNRMRMPNDEFYMKSPDEMRELFVDCPGGVREHHRDRREVQPPAGLRPRPHAGASRSRRATPTPPDIWRR